MALTVSRNLSQLVFQPAMGKWENRGASGGGQAMPKMDRFLRPRTSNRLHALGEGLYPSLSRLSPRCNLASPVAAQPFILADDDENQAK